MNEMLIKNIIKLKLNAADKIMEHLPPKISEELHSLSRIVLESINENIKNPNAESTVKTDKSNNISNITID